MLVQQNQHQICSSWNLDRYRQRCVKVSWMLGTNDTRSNTSLHVCNDSFWFEVLCQCDSLCSLGWLRCIWLWFIL